MAGRIILWSAEPGPAASAAADTVVAAAAFEQAADYDAAVERVRFAAARGEPGLLVLLPSATGPMPPLHRLAREAPDAGCLVLVDPRREAELRRALTFVPAPGGRWHIARSDDAALGRRIADLLAATAQKQRLRTTLDRMKLQLSAPAALDGSEHRRLVAADMFFSTVLRHASDAIVLTDENGALQTWNEGAARMFGIGEADAVGRPLAALFEQPSAAERLVRDAAHGTSGRAELQALVAGELRHIEATADGIRDPRGVRLGVVAILRDVTVQRRSQQALIDAARQKDEFLAMLAHELRNPLSPIRNAAQILSLIDTSGDPRIRRASDIIGRQVEHLTGLVDDLLDVARVTRGAVELDRRPVDMREIVAAAVEQARSLSDAKHQRLDMRIEQDLYVLGDAERLVQVLANLMNNAAKYTDEGGHISLAMSGKHGQVRVAVADDGMGIAPELLPRLFQLFTQGQRSSDRSQGGLGIGLALVRTLVELHGGSVSAASAGPGQGSTFTVMLPRIPRPPVAAPPLRTGSPPFAPGNRLRLMVVDDNADAAQTLAELLKAQGHVVDVHYDPLDALARADEVAPDVFILDIGMPHMDGYELAERLRGLRAGQQAVIIALTGYGQPEDRLRSRRAGFDHHLVKPLDADLLSSLLEQATPARPRRD